MQNQKKVHRAWSLYDWANSAYNLVITSTIFPAYYIATTTTEEKGDRVTFLGFEFINSALLNYSIALVYLVIAILSPILSSIADRRGNKKRFMQFFATLGSIACMGLYFFYPGQLGIGILCSMIAALGYCGSLVFYNAFLPEIATPSQQNKLSAQGFTYGYIGSVLLQIICLAFVLYPFEDTTFAPRLSFLLVGIWWFLFAQISIKGLPDQNLENAINHKLYFKNSFAGMQKALCSIKGYKLLRRYLTAFFFYSMGVQTVMLAAAEFGSKEVKRWVNGKYEPMGTDQLIIAILLIQLVAIIGAMFMAKLGNKIGNLKVLIINVCAWIIICVFAYYTRTEYQFYGIAILVGLVMGGIQSMSRSTFSKLIPATEVETTSYFSFYDFTEKIAIVIGMFSFGFIEHLTGNMRMSIFALAGFFILGLVFLCWALQAEKHHNLLVKD